MKLSEKSIIILGRREKTSSEISYSESSSSPNLKVSIMRCHVTPRLDRCCFGLNYDTVLMTLSLLFLALTKLRRKMGQYLPPPPPHPHKKFLSSIHHFSFPIIHLISNHPHHKGREFAQPLFPVPPGYYSSLDLKPANRELK